MGKIKLTNRLTQQAADMAAALRSASAEAVALAVFSGLIARGESFLTKRGLVALAERGVSPSKMHEIVLQSYLFCGFPRMLDALFDLAATIGPGQYLSVPAGDNPSCSKLAYTEDESRGFERSGRELIQLIYGERYEKLERAIVEMSPEVFRLMIMEGYGKTLSRPGLEIQTRELAVVAALTVDRRPRQLRAHLRGAAYVGVSTELLGELLRALSTFAPEETITVATNLLAEIIEE